MRENKKEKNHRKSSEKRQISEICYLLGGPQMLLENILKDLPRR